MNVNSPTCFQLASGFTINDAGPTSIFEIKPGATFKYGGSIATTGATGNIRTDTRTFLPMVLLVQQLKQLELDYLHL